MDTQSFYQFSAVTSDGHDFLFSDLRGKVVIVVNVASRCGFTPQYEGLEKLYRTYKDQGLVILGFPCNQFGQQEPGSDEEIKNFCSLNYGVSFPVLQKIEVNGENTHPLYVYLKNQAKGILGTEVIKWNFTKFLVDREGKVIERFAPTVTPENMEDSIKKLL